MKGNTPKTWGQTVDPLCRRLEIAAMFGSGFKFNAVGAQACADLLREMARVLDEEVTTRGKDEDEGSGGRTEPGSGSA